MAALERTPSLYSFVAHVSNLPETATGDGVESELRRVLESEEGGTESSSHETSVDSLKVPMCSSESFLDLKLVSDPATGLCKGFAFVTLSTEQARDGFIEIFDKRELSGSDGLVVQAAKPKKKRMSGAADSCQHSLRC